MNNIISNSTYYRHPSYKVFFHLVGLFSNHFKTYKVFKQGGAYYSYTDDKGKDYKFMSKDFPGLLEDEELKEELYQKICDKVIMEYSSANSVVDDDVEFEDNDEIAEQELASVDNE